MSTIAVEGGPHSISDQSPPSDIAPEAGVLVVDVDEWLRSRVCHLLENEAGFRLVGVAGSTEEAMRMAERQAVDVAVIGHRARSRSGLWLCRELKRSARPPAVVICSAYPHAVLTACCLVAEADALFSVYHSDAELAGVLDRVVRGVRFLPAVPPRVGAMLHERLEPAEHAIFSMLLAGLSAPDVARGLRMSQAELESRRSVLLGKLETLPAVSAKPY